MNKFVFCFIYLVSGTLLLAQTPKEVKSDSTKNFNRGKMLESLVENEHKDTVLITDSPVIASSDTLLREINGTTTQIALQTKPQRIFFLDGSKSSGYISLFAMLFGLLAAIFGWRGYVYQKKSASSLREMQPKRLPFSIFANTIYNNILRLEILIEIEESECEDNVKVARRKGYDTRKIFEEMKLPDDLIDLACYEKYKSNAIYEEAFSIIIQWRSFNRMVDSFLAKSTRLASTDLLEEYYIIKKELMSIFSKLTDWENMFRYLPDGEEGRTQIGAKSEFLLGVIRSYMLDCHKSIGVLNDPRVMRNNILELLCNDEAKMQFPNFERGYKEKWKPSLIEYIRYILNKLFIGGVKDDILLEIRTKKYGAKDIALLKILLSWYASKYNDNSYITDDTLADQISSILLGLNVTGTESEKNESSIEKLSDLWLDNYFNDEVNGSKVNVDFLLQIIYVYELADMREKMIKKQEDFYEEEKKYFNSLRKKHEQFGFYFSEEEAYGEQSVTLHNLISAMVAERTLKVSVNKLREWKYYDWPEVGDYENEFYVLNMLRGENIMPMLEKLDIIKDGRFLIGSADELNRVLTVIPDELLEYPLIPKETSYVSSFIYNLGLWCHKKFKILPYKNVWIRMDSGWGEVALTWSEFEDKYKIDE